MRDSFRRNNIHLIRYMVVFGMILFNGVFVHLVPWGIAASLVFIVTLLMALRDLLPIKSETQQKNNFYLNLFLLGIELIFCVLIYVQYPSTNCDVLGLALLFQIVVIFWLKNTPLLPLLRYTFFDWRTQKASCLVFPPALICFSLWIENYPNSSPKSLLIGGGFALILFFIFLPSWFVQQTANPSKFQRFCRNIVVFFCNFPYHRYHRYFPTGETSRPCNLGEFVKDIGTGAPETKSSRLFKYWLSHPGITLTEDLAEQIVQIDTFAFDWQDPTQWPTIIDLQL